MTGPRGSIGSAAVTGSRAMFAADTASRAAGIELIDVGPGAARVTMTIREDMANGHGIAHGGYVFLLADTAFACACNEEGSVTVAAGADITFLAPARAGDRLTAVASERSRRGRTGVYDVTVTRTSPDGEDIIAEFRGRSRSLPPPAAEHRPQPAAAEHRAPPPAAEHRAQPAADNGGTPSPEGQAT